MALFYGTPIVYSMSMVPAKLAWILNLNPMTPIVSAYRDILFYQKMPDFNTLLIECLIIILIFFVGLFSFRKLQRNFVEEL
jgi:ABC-2 type transport system permease protein